MAVFKRKNSSGWVVKLRDPSGRQVLLTTTPENLAALGLPAPARLTKRVARAMEAALERRLSMPGAAPTAQVLLSEAVERYMATRVASPSTLARDRNTLEVLLPRFAGDRPVTSFTLEDMERFKAWVSAGRSSTTVRDYVCDARKFFRWCVRVGILVSRGVPLEYVSKFLGHSDVRVTQTWYVSLGPGDFAEQVSKALREFV